MFNLKSIKSFKKINYFQKKKIKIIITIMNNLSTNSTINILYSTAWQIREYGSIACFTIGFLFNLILVIFFSQSRQLHNSSLSIYIIALCISNQFKLTFELPFDLFLNKQWSETFCQFYSWGRTAFGEIFSWILVVMALDRIIIFREHNITEIVVFNKKTIVWRTFIISFVFLSIIVKNFIIILFNLMDEFSFAYVFQTKLCLGFKRKIFVYDQIGFNYFYLGYQILYSYLPISLLIILNLLILFTILQLMYGSFIESSGQRDDKIKQIKKNEKIIILLTIIFGFTCLPNEIFKTIINFQTIFDENLENSISLLLNLLELTLVIFYFISYFVCFKKLRRFICAFDSRKKTVELVVELVPMETVL
jgi:hypothetical protein